MIIIIWLQRKQIKGLLKELAFLSTSEARHHSEVWGHTTVVPAGWTRTVRTDNSRSSRPAWEIQWELNPSLTVWWCLGKVPMVSSLGSFSTEETLPPKTLAQIPMPQTAGRLRSFFKFWHSPKDLGCHGDQGSNFYLLKTNLDSWTFP